MGISMEQWLARQSPMPVESVGRRFDSALQGAQCFVWYVSCDNTGRVVSGFLRVPWFSSTRE
jgi:hypothetical protein